MPGSAPVLLTDKPSPVPPTDGSSPVPPTDGSSPVPPTDGSSPVPPTDGSSPVPPTDRSSPVPPTDGSSPVPPMDGSSPVPPMDGSSPVSPITSPTTPAPPAGPVCGYQEINGKVHWTSPGFEKRNNYPVDFTCDISGETRMPMLTEYKLNFFSLQRKKRGRCVDEVAIALPFSETLSLCRPKKRRYTIPMTKYKAMFYSNERKTKLGFNITVSQRITHCHRLIDLSSNGWTGGVIKSPLFPKRFLKHSQCEYWIKAPIGKKILLRLTTMKMRYSRNCYKSYVAIDKSGSGWYYKNTSIKLCGRKRGTVISTGEMINLAFHGGNRRAKGFRATYTLV